jgi:predicted SAM-dependent methyltransferase
MKLHLGCGQNYLEGYVNIDYPLDHHSVQTKSVADKLADLTKLKYKKGTIEEIRLHHVFEHFPRAQAIALIASWNSWLKPGGLLRIEVPDFEENAKIVLSFRTSEAQKMKTLRHIFGSQEAPWANHYYGWSKSNLLSLVTAFGFEKSKINRIRYNQLENIEIITTKSSVSMAKASALNQAKLWLKKCLTDNSPSEKKLYSYWLSVFTDQLRKTWGA